MPLNLGSVRGQPKDTSGQVSKIAFQLDEIFDEKMDHEQPAALEMPNHDLPVKPKFSPMLFLGGKNIKKFNGISPIIRKRSFKRLQLASSKFIDVNEKIKFAD